MPYIARIRKNEVLNRMAKPYLTQPAGRSPDAPPRLWFHELTYQASWDRARRVEIADVDQDSWSSHLVWSNLYKVAPAAGGNPGVTLCQIQLAGCIELFGLELTTYTPSRMLLLTGTEWASPFLSVFDNTPQDVTGFYYVEGYGTLTIAPGKQPIRYVVAAHPRGKPENQWVTEVWGAFNL